LWRLQKAREHTQASHSKLTFAMFKANALDPNLTAVDASFRNIGYASGVAFDRWKTGINCMLLKKTNNYLVYLVNKLRTILLLAGMNYKKLYRGVMWFAELANAIPPELGGEHRKHRPIEQVLCSVLLNDLLRQKHTAAAIASSNFEGGFDRIVHAIAFICLRCLGMPGAPIQSMIDAIQAMTHFIRTAFGDSSANYSSDPLLVPYMGLLQGNAAVMAGCTAFVPVIVEMMKTACFGLNMWNALAYEAIKLVCLNFVCDTQLFHG
jgi:hypothetical protein